MFDKVVLSEKVADSIKKMIVDNELNPGDKLSNEIALSEALNVSRSTVREAIKLLASMNILEVRRGVGTFVSANPGLTKDPFGVSFMDQEHMLRDLFELRRIIEPPIAALAAERATTKDISSLELAFEALKTAILSGVNHTESDIAFHNIIAKSSKNPIIDRIVPIINEGILIGYDNTKDIPDSLDIVLHHHEQILEAIKNKDSVSAMRLMDEHLRFGSVQANKKFHS
ncbi:MAG: FadR/GntR family transcriptional regulator [Vallitaleaceae bacterium]|jgi:GntR family transcriptional repressor for pyruvate dehydrogenase complex|nr:FadR/GntR family transcriptional regulator [Vallitaleaceae bacterium]